jgi:hypothetical protein
MRRVLLPILAFFLLSATLTGFAQQKDIRQFAVYGAYSYLHTPSLNLAQRGFDGDVGYNYRPWLTFGFDFSYFSGNGNLFPTSLNAATQAKLAPFANILPANFSVPYGSTTYTYEAGPQLNYRRLKKVTFFVRPALGALHAKFNTTSTDPLTNTIVMGLLGGQLATADTVAFYGFGGGATWEITPNFGLRFATDFARYNFFSAALNGPRNSVRLSIGPKFGLGKNIMANQ